MTNTLEQHFVNIREKQERKNLAPLPNLNVFAEEIERAKTATIDSVRVRLPSTLTEPYGKLELFPEYNDPKGYADWKEMQKLGFTSQPIPGLKTAIITGHPELLTVQNPQKSWWAVEEYIKVLQLKNQIFGQTIRDEGNYFIKGAGSQNIWAFTHEDIARAKSLIQSPESFSTFAYLIGKATNIIRSPTPQETEALARPHLVEYVFGIQPPTDKETIAELVKIHKVDSRKNWTIRWTTPQELSYPLTKGVLSLYADAKDSGLFSSLEFGLLQEDRKTIDPVLAGTYQGFRIPLAYWK